MSHLFLHNYCKEHRPKLTNDEWNPSYKQAKRSLAQFNIELSRLTHQSAHRSKPHAMSGDKLIDDYFFLFMLNLTLQPADVAELRNLADVDGSRRVQRLQSAAGKASG